MRRLGLVALARRLEGDDAIFDCPLDRLVGVQNVLLDQLQRPRPVGQLVVERVGEPALLEHPLPLRQGRVHVVHVGFQDVLSDELLPVRPLLDLRLEQVPGLGALQLAALLVERGRRLEGRHYSLSHQLRVRPSQHQFHFQRLLVAVHGLVQRRHVDLRLGAPLRVVLGVGGAGGAGGAGPRGARPWPWGAGPGWPGAAGPLEGL